MLIAMIIVGPYNTSILVSQHVSDKVFVDAVLITEFNQWTRFSRPVAKKAYRLMWFVSEPSAVSSHEEVWWWCIDYCIPGYTVSVRSLHE